MRQSQMFGKTIREAPKDSILPSHKFLYQGGFIRESAAGRYYFLPLGWRVHDKIRTVIKKEMDRAGAQEMITPVLHPITLWKESNRTSSVGFELMKVEDRNGTEFVLGGTAEEMLVDLVRKFSISYKDLPFTLYQFSVKFRDELRARGGLLRLREFVMKDAYSFHATEEDFKKEYEKMRETYSTIFRNLGLETIVVESDNGYIGGEYCHEFVVESDAGESRFLTTDDDSYAAHEDVAKFQKYQGDADEEEMARKDVEGKGVIGVAELAKFLNIPVEKTTKTILFETEKGEVIAAAVNGIYDINEVKLKNIVGCVELSLARSEVVEKVTRAKVGYAGILNLSKEVKIIMDDSLRGRKNFECGANRTDYHSININFGRDVPEPERFYDIALAKEGYLSVEGKPLVAKKGIEVGNIFQLGFHYSSKMKGAHFIDRNGDQKHYYMGCYGIGLARTMATIVEMYHDEKGIMWPGIAAPFRVHLIEIKSQKSEVRSAAETLYEELLAKGIEVLYDDRDDKTAGEKFADADLIGIPWRVVVSEKTLEQNSVEVKARNSREVVLVLLEEIQNKFS
ncbi:MAG: prolyl-tRNA synthetase [Parcubacteria group bacterium Gr01-1014_33]|nr:MAG: prolyl-tRNA synthetase [Parcubacteria group bacterium Gr01-1014_33]